MNRFDLRMPPLLKLRAIIINLPAMVARLINHWQLKNNLKKTCQQINMCCNSK